MLVYKTEELPRKRSGDVIAECIDGEYGCKCLHIIAGNGRNINLITDKERRNDVNVIYNTKKKQHTQIQLSPAVWSD